MTRIPTYNYNNDIVKYKYLEKVDKSPEYPDIAVQASAYRFISHRNHSSHNESFSDKVKAGIGSVIGTIIPIGIMMKQRGIKSPLKLNYGLKEMLILSASSIMGGLGISMLGNDSQTNLNKSKEGIFQFFNAAIPTWLSATTLRWCETTKGLNNNPMKIISTLGAIIIGMYGSASVSNLICDPKDKHPDRKLTIIDSLANIDDLIGILVLAKVPIAEKLHIDKLLPLVYTYCGYRAGKTN